MAKRIKILFTIPNFKTAGSQYVLLSLFNKIDKTIFDPYVCVEKFPEMISEDIPATRQLVFDWTSNNLQDVMNLRKLLKKYKIDIVHSWDYKSNYWEPLATRLAGTKYLFTKKNNAWSKRWWLKSFLSNHIAYDNPEMKKRFFDSFLFQKKIAFVPHGVDIDIFKPMGKILRETFNIGCIGNIGSNKNQLFILQAMKELPDAVVLHLYGNEDTEYRVILDDFIAKNNLGSRVHFHGFVENEHLPEVFSNLDLFVLASFQEGLPVSILEAMACGIPVLSSDSGGGAKFQLKNGGGYLFDSNNPKTLVELLKNLYEEPEKIETISEEGRKNVVENFSLVREIAAYEKTYKLLAK